MSEKDNPAEPLDQPIPDTGGHGVDNILDSPIANDVTALQTFWRAHVPSEFARAPDAWQRLAQRFLDLGECLLAYDVASGGLTHLIDDVRLRQLKALALARSGATSEANRLLQELRQKGPPNVETFGLLARTHKDMALAANNLVQREQQLRNAHHYYSSAFRLAKESAEQRSKQCWTGINAATTALLIGEIQQAHETASEVQRICRAELDEAKEGASDSYSALATLGEAALVLGQRDQALDWYSQAMKVGQGRWGDVSATRRGLHLVLEHLNQDANDFDAVLQIPCVIVFAGHMIDHPTRTTPRFPPRLEPAVKATLRDRLEKLNAGFGYSSGACGSDILFLEAMHERNAEVRVLLPYEKDQFIKDSVDLIPHACWKERLEDALGKSRELPPASEQRLTTGSAAYEYMNILLLGLATLHAEHLGTELQGLAVWDGKSGDGPGGTASIVNRWKSKGMNVDTINVMTLLAQGIVNDVSTVQAVSTPQVPEEIKAILFADVVKFSHLSEKQFPAFVEHFLGAAARLAADSPNRPGWKNTWGDAFYFVFNRVGDAGNFALQLQETLCGTDWAAKGLPAGLSLRIALHAGPVHQCQNPVRGTEDFIGAHVNRGARLEPVTPSGQIYATQSFVAMAAAEQITDFGWEYVGQVPLPKGAGTFPAYHIRPRGPLK